MRAQAEPGVVYSYELVNVNGGGNGGDPSASGGLRICRNVHGLKSFDFYRFEFFLSPEFQSIRELAKRSYQLLSAGSYVSSKSDKKEIQRFDEAVNWLLSEAARGQTIQRYKGLGEMNPDQLWDTTMDPAARRLCKVKLEDAISANIEFSKLMGDEVEARREFIEKNALAAMNIDI